MLRVTRSFAAAIAATALLAAGLEAQRAGPTPTSNSMATSATPTGGGRPITPAEIKNWNAIRQNVLSADGKWFAYVVGAAETDAMLTLRGTAQNASETRINLGNGGGSVAISGDSKWIGYIVAPPRPPAGRAGGAGTRGGGAANRGGGGGGGGGAGGGRGGAGAQQADSAAAPRPTANKFVLMNLATSEKKEFDRIRTFSFNAESPTWIVLGGYAAAPEPTAAAAAGGRGGAAPAGGRGGGGGGGGAGGDLLLYNIASAELHNLGNVAAYDFDDSGEWLAYVMQTADQVGSGVQLRNMKTNVIRLVESERVLYRHLTWVDSSRALSVMRGRIDETTRDTVFSVALYRDFAGNAPIRRVLFDPSTATGFPAGWKLASERAPNYSNDMNAVFIGIREAARRPVVAAGGRAAAAVAAGAPGAGGTINQARAGGAGGEEVSLILWHAKDDRLQSQQMVQESADRNFNYIAEYRFDDRRFVRLADSALRNVTITTGDKFAYGTDNRAYQQSASYSGRNYVDLYSVDLKTGARKLIAKKKPGGGGMSSSPDGGRLLYWGTDGHYWVLDLATLDSVNITKSAPVRFIDTENDYNNIFPPAIGARGWTKDGKYVLLYDNWDLWKVPVKPGSEPIVNLTVDGQKNQVRYQRNYNFAEATPGAGGGGGGRGGRGGGGGGGIDLSKPLYLGTYGEWTKKEGLAVVEPGKVGAKSIFFEDARFNITKAANADVFTYTRQSFTEYPNWHVFNAGFKGGYQITDVNPQIKELAWSSGTRLIDYKSAKGDKLQAALYLPANYEPGKKYPLLVTIYEMRSQNKNGFTSPSETRAPDPALYTSRGYAVLDPDIVYRVNDPGMSAVWCVIPAVQAAIASGIVDGSKVGLWGHSWGGYQTAFLVTQTNIFKAAIAGAPLTDMVSMYSSVYWNSGGANQAIFESSQGRFKGNFIDNYQAYYRNSPAFFADKVTTPLMILHNDKDGAVDFNQGITYFNTLRQLGKDVILLEYVGENHGLARAPNQRDYAQRMTEYFDYHLKGAPPADWIVKGVPRLKIEEHLQSRRDTSAAARIIQP